ncbi:MAG: hypothetical protein GY953_48645, partial [bacterium]|nr:hypothetical protein [bacterium]
LESPVPFPVDGMVKAQIASTPVPEAILEPGEGPVAALSFQLPSNGFLDDWLTALVMGNAGNAEVQHLEEARLWRDVDGNKVFDPLTDTDLQPFVYTANQWHHPALNEFLPPGGGHFFVSVTAADSLPAEPVTLRFEIPENGVTVASDNDGPRDKPFSGSTTLSLSSKVLIAD